MNKKVCEFGLTAEEIEVFRLSGEGDTLKEIGEKLSISPYNVRKCRKAIVQKLGATNIVHACFIGYNEFFPNAFAK
ncbi:MAG: helix-turn-helix transcriptional regulator [Candidatus Gastranaerophilales bacterium]